MKDPSKQTYTHNVHEVTLVWGSLMLPQLLCRRANNVNWRQSSAWELVGMPVAYAAESCPVKVGSTASAKSRNFAHE